MPTVKIPTRRIVDWASFHDVFFEKMKFPHYYGRNMDAWIDCMGDLASHSDPLVLHLEDVRALSSRCPEIYDALVEGAAFVNFRNLEIKNPPILALAFFQ